MRTKEASLAFLTDVAPKDEGMSGRYHEVVPRCLCVPKESSTECETEEHFPWTTANMR